RQQAGDAFHVQGVPGAGKSHLLAVLALLAGDPGRAWPVFSEAHPDLAKWAASFEQPRLVAAVALDEYPTPSHPLEYVVFRRLEEELARDSGTQVALSEESHILDLVERYVRPQAGGRLDEYVQRATGCAWESLKQADDRKAAATAVDFVESEAFPLDWRRSRGEAWSKMEESLSRAAADGVVVILDELGTFLSSKDRADLNADASFLQWLAQRTVTSRAWLICATQRGMEEVGDIDRRTLRQMRDRFRAGITLDLSELEWVVRHKVAPRLDLLVA
ncbi:MAG: hypothetical protein JXA57_20600, partial [Armatimonadetes bacterium]|nr:hypothetical protein [Armatimonadota bacterium]